MRKKPQSRSISSLPNFSSFRRERNLYATTTDGLTRRTIPTDYYSFFCSDLIPLSNYQKRNTKQEEKKQSPQLSPWSDRPFFPSFKPQCVCPRLLLPTSKLMKTQKRKGSYQYNNISFPSSFYVSFLFLASLNISQKAKERIERNTYIPACFCNSNKDSFSSQQQKTKQKQKAEKRFDFRRRNKIK
jgi:hypothetical protein